MVNFFKKRLQVFVSSTYTDLIRERQAAVEAILTAGHIPAGMELFTSGDESQMEVIKQWINESDVYLLILGGRYGSIEPNSGKSYIHLEYEYAISQGKPLFSCVIKDDAIDERVKKHGKKVMETENSKKFREFKDLVLSNVINFVEDEKDIKLSILQKLPEFSRREDLIGWTKSNELVNVSAMSDELTRLSKENAELRNVNLSLINDNKSLKEANQKLTSTQHFVGLSFKEMTDILKKRKVKSEDYENLLIFFWYMRESLVDNIDVSENQENFQYFQELYLRGLVSKYSSLNAAPSLSKGGMTYTHYFSLTDEGYAFLNRLESELNDNKSKTIYHL